MKNLIPFVVIGVAYFAANASAASISVNPSGAISTINLVPGGSDAAFDTIFFTASPIPPGTHVNITGGVGRPPGQAFTYRNRLLTVDPTDDPNGLGLTEVGVTSTSSLLEFTVGKLGGTIQLPTTGLWLANIYHPGSVDLGRVDLIANGVVVQSLGFIFPLLPEPATFVLGSIGLLGLALVRRRLA